VRVDTEVRVAPTGMERVVAADELFFSTTDRRGVIRSGNSVFVRVSRFSQAELVGSPHSLVRHPDMPGGAYRLMWDRLLAGRPMGAYVCNLAKDGSHYWVFATVTPLGEGFLSVRMAPRGPLLRVVQQLYPAVRAHERELMAGGGVDRRTAAQAGAAKIESALDTLGYPSYDDFIEDALPAEVALRNPAGSAGGFAWARPAASGAMAELLEATEAVDGLLAGHVAELERYRELAERLQEAADRVLSVSRRLDRSVGAARQASEAVADSAPVLLNVATVMAQPMHTAVFALERLAPRLEQLRADVSALRFRIALASLHNDMVADFAAEVVDGRAPATSLGEVPLLCDAVHDGVAALVGSVSGVSAGLDDVSTLVAEAGARLDDFRRFLGQWRILVLRHRAGGVLGDLLAPIDEEIAAGHGGIDLLRQLGEQCRVGALTVHPEQVEEQLARIRRTARAAV